MKEIVLDTETTGLSVENGHRIVEIGCIELDDQILTSNRFHCYLNPQRKVSEEAFKEIETDTSSALITLTHDTKIDDPALKYALKNKFSYIGALGSKKTHTKRCERVINDGFTKDQTKTIYGPVGLKIGRKSSS